MVAFVALTLAAAVGRDLNVVSARLLLPAYPAVVAAATVGWASRRSRWATFALAISVTGFGLWFAVAEMLSRSNSRVRTTHLALGVLPGMDPARTRASLDRFARDVAPAID